MNPDQKLIQSVYEDTIKRIYEKLFEGYTEAAGVPAQETQAEQNFTKGVALARKSRDRAIALLA